MKVTRKNNCLFTGIKFIDLRSNSLNQFHWTRKGLENLFNEDIRLEPNDAEALTCICVTRER